MTVKKLASIGNSFGVIIDRPMLVKAGITPGTHIALSVEDGAVVVRAAPAGAQRTRGRRRQVAAPKQREV